MNNVLSTKVKIYRNVKDHKFTCKLSENEKTEIVNKIASVFNDFQKMDITNADESMFNYVKTCNLYAGDYPIMLLSKDECLAVNFFNSEHVTITATGIGFDSAVFERAETAVNKLSNRLSLSFTDDYGYLMSDLTKIGAGIELECDISLNAVYKLGKIEQVRQNVKKLGYRLNNTKMKNIYTLSTACNLGFSASEIYSEFSKIVEKVQNLEIESAKMLDLDNHDELLDNVSRSLAILKSAHMMRLDELCERINDIRLGVNIGIINLSNSKMQALNELTQAQRNEFVSKSELIELSDKVKSILKEN